MAAGTAVGFTRYWISNLVVVQALPQAGQPERALAAAEAIQNDRARSEALSQVAQALGITVA